MNRRTRNRPTRRSRFSRRRAARIPIEEAYFELEAHGIEMALYAKPWERLADEETEDAARE